jgi:hypothetical protein
VFIQFSNDNIWEIKNTNDSIIAFYRKGIILRGEEVQLVQHPERDYRLWKAYFNNNDGHMPDALPLIFMARSEGFTMINKVADSKYIFNRLR